MQSPGRILVFQTAFTGDVILTLPLIQELHNYLPNVLIDVVVTPSAAQIIANHPAISTIIPYDKKGAERGFTAAYSLIRRLRSAKYDVAIIPHRSIRSAVLCSLAGILRRIGFSTSAGKFLLTDVIEYDRLSHEVVRNLSLLRSLEITVSSKKVPKLYPSNDDTRVVDALLSACGFLHQDNLIAVAPGSVWATKRWLPDRYLALCKQLISEGFSVALIGGKDDVQLGSGIEAGLGQGAVVNAIGKTTPLQSAELIRRCRVAITNDSSPMHMAVAMGTPVVAIFGATAPEFGFGPFGEHDEVVQTFGLKCRPCAIHGGNSCPITTFVCMKNIEIDDVFIKVRKVLSESTAEVA